MTDKLCRERARGHLADHGALPPRRLAIYQRARRSLTSFAFIAESSAPHVGLTTATEACRTVAFHYA